MSDINTIITELSLQDIVDHIGQHRKQYLTGLLALAGGLGAAHTYKLGKRAWNRHQWHKKQKKVGTKIWNHLNRNREAYTGAAIGGISSVLSSKGEPTSTKLKRGLIGSIGGGLAGAAVGNIRKNEDSDNRLIMNDLYHRSRGK